MRCRKLFASWRRVRSSSPSGSGDAAGGGGTSELEPEVEIAPVELGSAIVVFEGSILLPTAQSKFDSRVDIADEGMHSDGGR